MDWRVDDNGEMLKLKGCRWLVVSALLVLVDQFGKSYANAELVLHQPIPVIAHLNLMLAYNPGAAFSFLSEAGGWQRWFFAVLSAAVSIVLIVWLGRLPAASRLLPTALALVIGGALGNLIDRIAYGYVIDFIQFYYTANACLFGFSAQRGHCYWPVFNVADAAVSVGATLLIIQSFMSDRDDGKGRHKNHPR